MVLWVEGSGSDDRWDGPHRGVVLAQAIHGCAARGDTPLRKTVKTEFPWRDDDVFGLARTHTHVVMVSEPLAVPRARFRVFVASFFFSPAPPKTEKKNERHERGG